MRNLTSGMVLWMLAAGCGGDDAAEVPDAEVAPDAEVPREPEGDHHPYVIDSIRLPTTPAEAAAYGLDLDGDGDVDNQLETIVELLTSNGADINGNIARQVDRGELIELADLQATALDDAENAAIYVWTGGNPSPAPCTDEADEVCRRHLTGSGSFDVTSPAPAEAMIFGALADGRFEGSHGVIELSVPIFVGDATLDLLVVGASIEAQITGAEIEGGKLGGAVPATYIDESVMPQLEELIGLVVERDCGGTAPDCCVPETDGAIAIELFDTDDSCTVTLAELRDNALLGLLLEPDVDLLDEDGEQHPDGVPDSVSLGISFTAVPAQYEIPPGLP
jgi:hypothetical protein